MKFTEMKVDKENLEHVLARSRYEFLSDTDLYPNFLLRFCLGISDPLTEAKYYEILEGESICASFMLVYKHMKLDETNMKICFLTQVIISSEYRGQGLTHKIAQLAERMALRDGAGVTFVIARRAVKDLYAKLGFVGFSHFSQIKLSYVPGIDDSHRRKTYIPEEKDLKNLVAMHKQAYSGLKFFLIRSEESFKHLLKLPNYKTEISEDDSFYLISSSNEIVEIGMKRNARTLEILATIIFGRFESMKINKEHEIFRLGVKLGMLEENRFEPREGHLLKIHANNLSSNQILELEVFKKNPGAQFAELSEIDQW
jgi:hypothetical protein